MSHLLSFRPRLLSLGVMLLLFGSVAGPACAERPSAPKLLPKKTLAYVRVADSRELAEAFMKTSVGRLSQDEKIRPLIMHLFGSATQAFAQVQQELGVSLSEILAIPQGELCVAVVGREEGPPAVVVLAEVGDKLPVVRKLLERGEQEAVKDGTTVSTDEADGVTLKIYDGKAALCDRDGVVLFGTDVGLVKEILRTWTGDAGAETLADNREFTTIMSRSVGTRDERPQVSWFVDPIALFKDLSRDNAGAQIAIGMLPVLGLNGLKSAGGSMIYATEDFDSIAHMHLLMDNPRNGVLAMIALQAGDTSPESWVPVDAASYMTMNWDTSKTVDGIRKLFEQFNGEGAMGQAIKGRLSDPLGFDFEKEVIGQVGDRFTHVSWFEKPARVNSGTNLVGVRLVDAAAFESTLGKLAAKAGSRGAKKSYRGITYYQFTPRRQQEVDQDLVRQPSPAVAIVGDYLLVSDSSECLEAAISAKSDASKAFADELDYKLIASRIQQHSGSAQPAMIVFQRPEESMRSFYELATSPTTRRKLEELAQTNQALRALNDALKANPLPPFSEINKYLAPAGGMLISDETGIHYTAFGLKRE